MSSSMLLLDRDECALSEDWCDNNAKCDNTIGGFTCTCNDGRYTNDTGKSCYGMYIAVKKRKHF